MHEKTEQSVNINTMPPRRHIICAALLVAIIISVYLLHFRAVDYSERNEKQQVEWFKELLHENRHDSEFRDKLFEHLRNKVLSDILNETIDTYHTEGISTTTPFYETTAEYETSGTTRYTISTAGGTYWLDDDKVDATDKDIDATDKDTDATDKVFDTVQDSEENDNGVQAIGKIGPMMSALVDRFRDMRKDETVGAASQMVGSSSLTRWLSSSLSSSQTQLEPKVIPKVEPHVSEIVRPEVHEQKPVYSGHDTSLVSLNNIEYPNYVTPIVWSSFQQTNKRFECVPLQSLSSVVRICIYPLTMDHEISSFLKSRATWEFRATRDMQLALLETKTAGLIDIGSGIGVYSLSAAGLNRRVVAVEPLTSHIQVFAQSVRLNGFSDRISLFQNVVLDRRDKVIVKPLDNDVNNIEVINLESDKIPPVDGIVVRSITLNDIAGVCTFSTAVLKIDIPNFVKLALEHSDDLFKRINITHVILHWDTSDREMSEFALKFFVARGYAPFAELFGNLKLETKNAMSWNYNIVVWKKL